MPDPAMQLSEHQGVGDDHNPDRDKQSPEAEKAAKLVERLYKESKRFRDPHDRNWLTLYKFFRGNQWSTHRPSYRHSEVVNLTFGLVQSILPILTDNQPIIETVPEEPSDFQFSQLLNHILKSNWVRHHSSHVLAETIVDSAIYGTGISTVEWDEELKKGIGDYVYESIDPFFVYVDPNTRDFNDRHGNYVIIAEPKDVGWIRAKYPDKRHLIKSDLNNLHINKVRANSIEEFRFQSPTDNRVIVEDGKALGNDESMQALIFTCWIKDQTIVEEQYARPKEKVDGNNDSEFKAKKKYPKGRKIVVCNGIVLEDTHNPYEDGLFPFARLVDHIMPREFWGVGEIEQQRSPQDIINKLLSYMLDTLTLMGNPIWVVDSTSGVDVDNLVNAPGLVVEKNEGSEVRREAGVPLQPYIFQLFQYLHDRTYDKISGMNEISQGGGSITNQSGIAVERLQEAAQTRLRQKSRNIDTYLNHVGILMVSRILQYYKVPRVIRLTNDGSAEQFFKFKVGERENADGVKEKTALFSEFEFQEDLGRFIERDAREVPLRKGIADVRMTTGSSLPFIKSQKANLARELFQLQVIDAEDLLEAIEYPKREQIIEKLKIRQQQAAQLAAEQAAAGQEQLPLV